MAEQNPYLSLVTGGAVSAAESAPNDYSAMVQGAQNTSARLSMLQVADKNPDVEARLQDLAKQYSVPPETIRLDQSGYEARAKIDALDYDALAKNSRATFQMVNSPGTAAICYDDTQNMSAIESGIGILANSFRRGVPGLQQSIAATSLRANQNALAQFDAVVKRLDAGEAPGSIPAEQDPLGVAYMTPAQRQQFREQITGSLAGNIGTVAATQRAQAAIPSPAVVGAVMQAKTFGDAWSEFMKAPVQFIAATGPQSLMANLPGMVAAVPAGIAGGPAAAAAVMGAGSFSTDYGSSIVEALGNAGVDVQDPDALQAAVADPKLMQQVAREAFSHAAVVGTVDAASGGAASKFLLPGKALAGRPVAREVANLTIQTPVQGVFGGAGELGGEVLAGQEISPGNILAEIVGEAFGAPGEVASITGKQIVHRLQQREQQATVAQDTAKVLTDLNDLAANSKLRERSPDAFAAFVRAAAEDGPVQDIYIDAEALAQSGVDLAALVQASPAVAAQLADASVTGGSIRIPLDEYATNIAGTDMATALFQHLKTDPAGMTVAEGEAFMKDQAGALKAEVQAALSEQEAASAFATSRQVVEQQIADELAKANRFTPDVNASYAKMMAAFYGTQAARLGITPEELAARYPLQIRSTMGGEQLNQGQQPDRLVQAEAADKEGTPYDITITRTFTGANRDTPQVLVEARTKDGNRRGLVDFSVDDDGTLRAELAKVAGPYQRKGLASAMYKAAQEAGYKIAPGRAQTDSGAAMVQALQREGVIGEGAITRDTDYQAQLNQEGVPDVLEQRGDGTRGGYSGVNIGGEFTGPSIITLLQNADLSTFLHESGHYYLEVLADLARQPNAPAEIQQDMQAVLDWFGVPSLEAWTAMSLEEKRDSHEKWARGFEAYLLEGKSPNSEMNGIFARFRSWLLNIYRAVQSLNVDITPEIRSVFDRMLSSADAIAEAQSTAGMLPLFDSAEAAGMTPQEWEGYQRLGLEAQQDAQDGLEKRTLKDVKWLDNARSRVIKELQKSADTKREAIRDEMAAEVYAQPVYSAMQFLRRGLTTLDGETVKVDGAHKLSIDALKDMYMGEGDPYALLDWSKLGYGKYGMLAKENGLHPDVVAQMFGFTSGDQLVQALLSARPVNEVINQMTDERMLQRYGEMSDPAAIARAADEAVHNEARSRFVATEANALAKATGSPRILAAAARNFANDMVARLRVRDIKPGQYVKAEGKVAKAARDAMASGDLKAAAAQKRNQLINNYAATAALKAQSEIDAAIKYLKKFDSAGVRKSVNIDYRDQIDALLDRYDLRTGQSLRAIDKRKSLAEWVKQQEDKGLTPVIDPALLDEANRKSYKDMTVEELRGLRDAVKNIEHLGRLKNKMLTAKDQRDFDDVADAVQAAIVDNAKGIVQERRISDRGFLVQPTSLFRKFLAMHRKFASTVRQFDGWKDGGTAWEYMVRNMNDAGDYQAVQNEKATEKLTEIFKPLLEGRSLGTKTFFPAIGKSFTHEERIGIALNMGNEVNRERVLSGENLAPGQLQAILDTITEKEWNIVQEIWDYLDTFRPAIAAKERRISGVEPEWVEAQPVVTKYGVFKGGYYPIAYDPLRSTRSEADTEAQVARQMQQGMYTRAQTRRGHLKERVESTGRPLRYDLNVVGEHVQQVIHDLAWQEYLIDTNRLLADEGIDNAIRTHYGPETLKNMRDLMTDIAVGNVQATTALDNIMNHLRTGATITGLGFRFTTSLMQPLGLTQSMVRIGPKWVARGISHWGAGVLGLEKGTKDMFEMSDFMRLRGKTMQREINEIQNRVRGLENTNPLSAAGLVSRISPEAGQKLLASYFYLIAKAQLIADVPTWWGAYEKAMAEPDMVEEKAIALADQAVRDSQGGGQIGDLAAVQRGGSGQKLFTNFYSFFNTTYQLTAEVFGRTNFRSPKDVAFLVADLALLYMVPSILGTLVKAGLKGEDDPEELAKSIIADLLGYTTGTMVGLREISAAIQAAVGSGPGDYTGPASVRFFADLAKFAKQAKQGEPDAAFWKSLNNVGGTLFHYPAGQINATVQGINALADGKTENPGAVLVGAPPKR